MTASTPTVKPLGDVAVGDRIMKFGYLPRYPHRPIHVIASIERNETHTRYTFTDEGHNHEPWAGVGMNHVECEVL